MGRSFLAVRLAVIFGLLVGAAILVAESRIESRDGAVAEVPVRAASLPAPVPGPL